MTSDVVQIPFEAIAQSFAITLGGVALQFATQWNEYNEAWEVSIYDDSGVLLIGSLPLVCGVNILEQHQHVITGAIVCYTDGNPDAPPTEGNLGATSNAYYVGDVA